MPLQADVVLVYARKSAAERQSPWAEGGMTVSFILEAEDGHRLIINAWNWVPTIQLLGKNQVLTKDQLERMRYNGCDGRASAEDCARIATFLEAYLAQLAPASRVLLDGDVTTEADTYEFDRDDLERNYSATFDWLSRFRAFCERGKSFVVY
jgi:hypothetical protein